MFFLDSNQSMSSICSLFSHQIDLIECILRIISHKILDPVRHYRHLVFNTKNTNLNDYYHAFNYLRRMFILLDIIGQI